MGLYDRTPKIGLKMPIFRFSFDWRRMKKPVLGIGVALIALFFALSIAVLVQPRALDASLSPNPLDLSKDFDSYLTVSVYNVSGSTASNVVVSVKTEASDSITIYPHSLSISTLGAGETRTLAPFVVSPNPSGETYSGTYIIAVTTEINGQAFEKQVSLQLKAV